MNVLTFPVMGINGKQYKFRLWDDNKLKRKVRLINTCKYSVETPEKFNLN